MRAFAVCFVSLCAIRTVPVYSETVFLLKNGKNINGESVDTENDKTYTVKFYREFVRKIPRQPVAEVKVVPFSGERELDEIRKKYADFSKKDVKKQLEMVDALVRRNLTSEAAAILFDLRKQYPSHPLIKKRGEEFHMNNRQTTLDEKELNGVPFNYFGVKNPDREQIIKKLQGRDWMEVDSVKEMGRVCLILVRKGKKVETGDSIYVSEKPGFNGKLHIELWRKKGTNKEPNEKWPVLIALHGGGRNKGYWKLGAPTFFSHFKKYFDRLILVAPTVLHKRYAEWAGNPLEECYVHQVFRAVKRTWNVDTNRVFLAGVSMGAYGTWHMGGHRPDCFAGLVSNAGGILIGTGHGHTWGWGIIGNLMHTPIAFIHGGRDTSAPPWSDAQAHVLLNTLAKKYPGSYRHKYISDPNWGHAVPGHSIAEAVKFVASNVRDPLPKKNSYGSPGGNTTPGFTGSK